MFNIEEILKRLAKQQPVFHSEADFQHALAWEIHTHHPSVKIRLEIHPGRIGRREYIDIWIKDKNRIYLIELKHKTKAINATHDSEKFYLLNQGAQNFGRYDFLKDVARLERFVSVYDNAFGYAILLTNDKNYWEPPRNQNTIDADFRIHEGRKLKRRLEWGEGATEGVRRGRDESLILKHSYSLQWFDYSKLSEEGPNQFRYLLLKIPPLDRTL